MFDYNSALFDIVSRLELCGIKLTDAELLEKTFSTFHASNIVLQQQYRQRQFATYSDLIDVLDECKTHLCFEFISHAILCIWYPYSCKLIKFPLNLVL